LRLGIKERNCFLVVVVVVVGALQFLSFFLSQSAVFYAILALKGASEQAEV